MGPRPLVLGGDVPAVTLAFFFFAGDFLPGDFFAGDFFAGDLAGELLPRFLSDDCGSNFLAGDVDPPRLVFALVLPLEDAREEPRDDDRFGVVTTLPSAAAVLAASAVSSSINGCGRAP